MLLSILHTRRCDRHSMEPPHNYNTEAYIEFQQNCDRTIAFLNRFSGTATCPLCIKTAVFH